MPPPSHDLSCPSHLLLRRAGAALAALISAASALVWTAPMASASPWGTTGADYSGGIVCTLPDASTVPLARWSVDGSAAFSTADVVRSGALYGPAPTTGFAAPMTAGQSGFSADDIAAVAYLIERYGSGSAAEVAETSAVIASLSGRGSAQSQCLGQQGTSRAHASAVLSAARRYAGPYTVAVADPARPTGGGRQPVSATVRSAAGAVTPGLPVQFRAGASLATATTDASGVASTTLPVQRTAVTLTATVEARTGLTYIRSNPPAVAEADPVPASATGRLAAVTPEPVLTVNGSSDLILSGGHATPSTRLTGTFGYSGSGALTVAGPVSAGTKSCRSLPSSAFARAATVSTAPFTFRGDGDFEAGATPDLDPGCYVARASLTTTDSSPPVKATSAFGDDAVFTVASVSLAQTNAVTVAPAGPLTATVTAAAPGAATVTSSLVARGPLATATGDCSRGLTWSNAPFAATSGEVSLAEQQAGTSSPASTSAPPTAQVGPQAPDGTTDAGGSLSATLSTPSVSGTGCYSLVSRNTVTLDGRSVTVEGKAGASGTTVLVAKPRVSIANADYDGQIGTPMTGTVTVDGSFAFAGTISVGLIATELPAGGCHPVTFTDRTAAATPVQLATKGDGTYTFRSPKPRDNLCYSVTAVLSLDANRDVRSASSDPSTSTIFLAGVSLRPSSFAATRDLADSGVLRPVLTVSIAYGLLFAIALAVVLKAAAARRPEVLRRPSPG